MQISLKDWKTFFLIYSKMKYYLCRTKIEVKTSKDYSVATTGVGCKCTDHKPNYKPNRLLELTKIIKRKNLSCGEIKLTYADIGTGMGMGTSCFFFSLRKSFFLNVFEKILCASELSSMQTVISTKATVNKISLVGFILNVWVAGL